MSKELIKTEQWSGIARLYGAGGVPMPFVQEIFLLECEVAGTGFVKGIEKRAETLTAGAVVSLVREAENKYDALAIRIDTAAGGKLGYIPRKKNEVLARLLDGGKMLYGKVVSVEFSDYSSWVDITVKIYMKDL